VPKAKRVPPIVDTVAVAIERAGRLLLLRRPPRGLWGGLWEPLAGTVRLGEEPAAAAARLAGERTGLRLAGLSPIGRFEHVLTHRRMRFAAYRADGRGRLRVDGYDDGRWYSLDEARRLGVAAWTVRLLGRLQEEKGQTNG
jgi:A/G-specific adenine glycosylase